MHGVDVVAHSVADNQVFGNGADVGVAVTHWVPQLGIECDDLGTETTC